MPRLSALLYNHNQNQKTITMSKMQGNQLKEVWMDLNPSDRYRVVGQVIDGMIYHAECVNEVKEMLARWDENGFLKSIILPDSEPDTMCHSCSGTGEGSTPETSCWNCKGHGAIIPNSYDYEG